MKSNDLIYLIGSIVVILGTAMKILHLPYANMVLNIGLVGVFLFMTLKLGTKKENQKTDKE